MKAEFKNLGPIKKATLDIRPLTVVIGPNNTGKSHIAYTVYRAMRRTSTQVRKLLVPTGPGQTRAATMPDFSELWRGAWQSAASASTEDPAGTARPADGHPNEADWTNLWMKFAPATGDGESELAVPQRAARRQLLARHGAGEVVIFPAERTSMFEYLPMWSRAAIGLAELDNLQETALALPAPEVNGSPMLDLLDAVYAAVEMEPHLTRRAATEFAKLAETLVDRMQDGHRVVWNRRHTIPLPELKLRNGKVVPLANAATSIKQLAPVLQWVSQRANAGTTLVIDEPEINLHPENQARITEGLAILVNLGVRVFVTTHSPYIVDHLNNLMAMHALKPAAKAKVSTLLKLQDSRAIINPESVAVYETTSTGRVKDIVNRRNKIVDWGTFGEVSEYVTNLYADVLNAE